MQSSGFMDLTATSCAGNGQKMRRASSNAWPLARAGAARRGSCCETQMTGSSACSCRGATERLHSSARCSRQGKVTYFRRRQRAL